MIEVGLVPEVQAFLQLKEKSKKRPLEQKQIMEISSESITNFNLPLVLQCRPERSKCQGKTS